MKEIKAYIRPQKADIVIEKLEKAGVKGMTILDANALADWADKDAFSFSMEYVEKYSRVVKLEIVCNKEDVEELLSVLQKYAYTGESGDGWIFVSNVEKAIRIKTGQTNKIN